MDLTTFFTFPATATPTTIITRTYRPVVERRGGRRQGGIQEDGTARAAFPLLFRCFSAAFLLLFRCFVLAIDVCCSSPSLSLSSPVTAPFLSSLLHTFHFVQKCCCHQIFRRTDGRTDGQTDGQTDLQGSVQSSCRS